MVRGHGLVGGDSVTWWAVHVGSTREFAAQKSLERAGIVHFLPHRSRTYKIRFRGCETRKKRTVREALFPGYIFVDPGELDSAAVEGAIDKKGRVIKIDGTPLVLDERDSDGFKDARLEADENGFVGDTDSTALSFGFLGRPGMIFRFTEDSPFAGHLGTIVSMVDLDKRGSIVAFIELFKAPRAVIVAKHHVGELISLGVEASETSLAA